MLVIPLSLAFHSFKKTELRGCLDFPQVFFSGRSLHSNVGFLLSKGLVAKTTCYPQKYREMKESPQRITYKLALVPINHR